MFVALTSTYGLRSRLGQPASGDLVERLEVYAELASDRTPMRVAVLDDDDSMAFFGLRSTLDTQAFVVRELIRLIQDELQRRGDRLDGVLLVGGDDVFPFWRFTNPVADRLLDPDPIVLSDNPYGLCEDVESLRPTVPVGRLCDGGSADALREALDAMIAAVRQPAPRAGSLAAVNEAWIDMSAPAVGSLEVPVAYRVCPYYKVTGGNTEDFNRRFLYFNMHGFDGDPVWKGYDADRDLFADCVTPASFTVETTAGALIVSEVCYGAQVVGRRTDDSCAVAAQHCGAAAFIGATGLVFGSFLQPMLTLADADRLAPQILERLVAGSPAGSALCDGRRAFLESPPRELTPYEKKTALQFVLLGDPSRRAA